MDPKSSLAFWLTLTMMTCAVLIFYVQAAYAGGPVQQPIVVEVPPADNTLAWVAGVVTPVVLAVAGWWLNHRRKK